MLQSWKVLHPNTLVPIFFNRSHIELDSKHPNGLTYIITLGVRLGLPELMTNYLAENYAKPSCHQKR